MIQQRRRYQLPQYFQVLSPERTECNPFTPRGSPFNMGTRQTWQGWRLDVWKTQGISRRLQSPTLHPKRGGKPLVRKTSVFSGFCHVERAAPKGLNITAQGKRSVALGESESITN